MIARIRRWRLITLLLLLATPATGGTALQALHPCPESAPWAAGGDTADAHAGHHIAPAGEDGAPAEHTGDCHCVGACAAAALVLAPVPAGIVALHADAEPAPDFLVHAEAPRARPADRLPPATAPPLI